MGAKWNLVIDIALCENCSNCVLATKDELVGNSFEGYSAPHPATGAGVLKLERHVRGETPMVDVSYLPRMCNQCDNAPCVQAGGGAVRKRDDGIVVFDPVQARGRRDLVDSCPYGAVVWNEEQQLPQTWFFDAHLLDAGWEQPRCAGACPTQAMRAVKLEDAAMQQKAQAEGLRVLAPELGLQPRVYYRNLDRADRCFIGGSVTALIGAQLECIAGAHVELRRAGELLARSTSDTFGDFRFDGILRGSGPFDIVVRHPEHGGASMVAQVGDHSVVLGEVRLSLQRA